MFSSQSGEIMYTLTEIFFILVVAFILGGLSFILAGGVVLVKSGFNSSIQIARRIRVQVAALGWDR
jgi:hypothetical protein